MSRGDPKRFDRCLTEVGPKIPIDHILYYSDIDQHNLQLSENVISVSQVERQTGGDSS